MSKISELSDGGSLTSTDFLIAVRSGGNVKVKMDTINVDQVDLGDNEFIRLGNSQDLTMVHTSTQSIINQAGIGDLLIQKAGATKLTINSSGIGVAGNVTASRLITGDGIQDAGSGGSESVFNNGQTTSNFRVATTGNANTLFVDGGTNKVGIGTSSIDGTLHVHTASAGTVTASSQADDLVIENSAEGGMTIITPDDQSARIRFTSPSTTADVGGASIFYRQNINKMSMGTEVAGGILALKSGAGSEGLLLDASGNFIVGATSAFDSSSFCVDQSGFGQFRRDGTPLLVRRDGSFGDLISFEDDGASKGGIRTGNGTLDINTASSTSFTVLQNGAAKMEIAGVNGSLYLYAQATGAGNADLRYTTSDGKVTYDTSSRLVKDEIEEIPYGLNTVMALSPKRYIRTDSDNKLEVGFIADEVVEVVPELVGMMEKRFLTMNQEDTEMVAGSVEYNKMTAVLVKAIQEQQATIEALTARIAALES